MRAVAYVRVSTEEQAREGVSLAAQSERLAAYCVARDWCLVGEERDEGVSGKTLDRPGLKRVLDLVNSGKVDVVLVYKLDRLTRRVADLGRLMDLFERRNVALVSVSESFDATTATGRMTMNLLASVSQWEREVIAERTRDALAHKRRHLKAYGTTPYGFDRRGDKLIPNCTELAVVDRILALRLRGLTMRAIVGALNSDGIPTKTGKEWRPGTVAYILSNGLYEEVAAS